MNHLDPLYRSGPPRRTVAIFARFSVFAASLLGFTAISGCLPVSDFGYTDTTAESISGTAGMTATSAPSTPASGGTLDVTTSTSSSSTTGATPTTTNPTCGEFTCQGDMSTDIECDVFAQDCPDGQKCAAVILGGGAAWNAARCVPVSGTDEPGDPCTIESVAAGLDSCIKGAMCWDDDGDFDGNGTCVELCMGTPDAPLCADNGYCTFGGDGVLNFCLPGCDPLLQDCNEGAACYPINDGFICAPDASGDAGKANDPCEFINVCKPGLLCAGPEFVGAGCPPGSQGCCTPFCTFPGGICPNPDQQCIQWYDPVMFPVDDPLLLIGFCGVPQ
jgi:hypothetical protein